MDCGKPTSEKTHASSLSFEFSHGSEKLLLIVVLHLLIIKN